MIPQVDIKTKEISGCKKGSIEYFHELGHLNFLDTDFGKNLQYFFEQAHTYLLGTLSLSFFISFFKYISVTIFLFMIFCILYEEYYANNFARERYLKENLH